MQRLLLPLLLTVLLGSTAHAQRVSTPAPGSAERKAIMNVLRVPAEKDLRQKVIFRVSHLKLAGDWAFARVVPIRPDGSEIDYRKTKYRQDMEEGAFDAEAEALLRRHNGAWELVEWRFGASDTEVDIWMEKYRFPRAIAR